MVKKMKNRQEKFSGSRIIFRLWIIGMAVYLITEFAKNEINLETTIKICILVFIILFMVVAEVISQIKNKSKRNSKNVDL